MSTFEEFWNEFQARFKRAPVWLPGTKMQLGDIAVIDRRGYLKVTTLAKLGIGYEEEPSVTDSQYSVLSQKAKVKDIQATAAASEPSGVVGQVEAGVHMSFEAERAFVVWAAHVQGNRIADPLAVESEIRRLDAEKRFWNKEYIYVQEVVTAQPCIMVVSQASGANATVTARGSGPGLAGFTQLLHAGTGLQLSSEVASVQQIVTPERSPFMWRGRWLRGLVKKSWDSRGGRGGKVEGALPNDLYEDFDDPALFDQQ